MRGETFSFVLGAVDATHAECVWTIYRGEARDLARCSRHTGAVVGGYQAGVVHGWLWSIRSAVEQHRCKVQGVAWIGAWRESDMELLIAGETVTLVSQGLRFSFDELCRLGVLTAGDWAVQKFLIELAKELMFVWSPPSPMQFRAQRAAQEAAKQRAHG
ncbi:MAG: hypothetical protein KBC94_07800 [Pseudacidovorax sp.]|uniref:hypothetical protein n=1 Tax=Pseudacidovorax sp. TaxID=1934311 RepID=UPI001B61B30F|nr:hypothetical protein [Pseudacidovorax sp.]MBP6894311.1 hypothetical protein [Pseudacidovorax sp.]